MNASLFFPGSSCCDPDRIFDAMVHHTYGMAKTIADGAGTYHLLLIGCGMTFMLPLFGMNRSRALSLAHGLNLASRHKEHIRLTGERSRYSIKVDFLPRIKATDDEKTSIMLSIAALFPGIHVERRIAK